MTRTIDYARMQKVFPGQKRALTLALKEPDPAKRVLKVIHTCRETVKVWDQIGAWPDDWARWQRALSDVGVYENVGML